MKHTIQELETIANNVRQDIIGELVEAGSGHSAGPLGMADVFVALYFEIMDYDPKNPDHPERDRLILSNGHICPVRYATMAEAGMIPMAELKTLRKLGSRLQGHPERLRLPGIETTSGPLGSGLAQASGYAYAARMDEKKFRIYCICSDGEHDEGNHWEAVMFAGKYKLSNLTVIVDRNNIQIDGFTEDVMPLEPLIEKYRAFGWSAIDIDGHNFQAIMDAVGKAKAVTQKPTVIIAHTIPGKGVKFMEGKFEWHGKIPTPAEAKVALNELRTLGGRIQSEHE
ncbi:MAG TPA: transketolase [Patescibacteria group bacterium]|nr:transketolase [Patescibacteria group bacterium]